MKNNEIQNAITNTMVRVSNSSVLLSRRRLTYVESIYLPFNNAYLPKSWGNEP